MNLPVWIIDPSCNRINFHESFELQYFINEWKISEAQLKIAKRKAESSIVSDIYRQLIASEFIKEYSPNDATPFRDQGKFVQDGGE